MFAHDVHLTGSQLQDTGITKANVASLRLRWTVKLPDALFASPLVYGGLVIVCSNNQGIVYALDAKSGNLIWQRQLGNQVRMTPAIADGMLFVGTHLFTVDFAGNFFPAPSNFYALDLLTGAVRWQIPIDGTVRSPALVLNGKVYIGVAGGDPPTCFHGGILAVDEASGAVIWTWYVDPNAGRGGAVWAPLSYDGVNILAGTGNTCEMPVMTANGLVALDATTGKLAWSLVSQQNSLTDDDTGGGALVTPRGAYFISKTGTFYSVNASSGQLVFSKLLNATAHQGGWGTPTTDGATIVISGGVFNSQPPVATRTIYRVRMPQDIVTTEAELFGLDYGGNVKWSIASQSAVNSYVAMNNGIGYAPLDNRLVAIDVTTGVKLWAYTVGALLDSGAAVVPSGVYIGDTIGNVYAFGLPSAPAPAMKRHS